MFRVQVRDTPHAGNSICGLTAEIEPDGEAENKFKKWIQMLAINKNNS